jgi:predicted amidohydrolase
MSHSDVPRRVALGASIAGLSAAGLGAAAQTDVAQNPSITTPSADQAKTMIMYRAVPLQIECLPINASATKDDARALMRASIARLKTIIPGTRISAGADMKLVVLPEYVFTGFPMGMAIPKWADWAAMDIDGPEYEALARLAQDNKIYLCGNAYERDANFPGIFFQACFIFDPSGKHILRYRRLTSMFSPTPHDYWEKFLDLYGMDGVFPVAKTDIGNLAAIASEEIQYPELVRSFVLRGAEVLCHPSAEPFQTGLTPKDIAKRARAIENLAYVVSANVAGHRDIPFLTNTCDGLSKVIDFQGRVLAEAGPGETAAGAADINITALRRYRNKQDINNFLPRLRMELYAETYQRKEFYPANTLLNAAPTPQHFGAVQRDAIARLRSAGVIEPEG